MINRILEKWKKSIESIDERKLFWVLNIGIIAFYFLYFFVITQSCYSADDLFNSNARAVDFSPGDSVWKLTIRQAKIWLEAGRFFPFSNYAYLLFAYVTPTRFTYKLLILVTVYLNNILFAKCIGKITKSKEIGFLTMLLFPMCIQLTCEFESTLYCFHMLMQLVLMWSTISLLMVFRYVDKIQSGASKMKSFWYLIVSALCLCLAVGTYEVGYIMAAFIGLGVWAYTGKIGKTLKVLIPNIMTYAGMLYGNYWFRTNAAEIGYDGIAINFNLDKIFITFLKQCYSTLPFAKLVVIKLTNGDDIYSVRTLLASLRLRDALMILIYLFLIITVVIILDKKIKDVKNLKFVFFTGISLFLFPACLISLMTKYQNELAWGDGHLSNYIQNFGLLLIITTFVILVLRKCNPNVKKIISILLICTSVGVLIGQEMDGRASVEYRQQIYGYPRENVERACAMGITADVGSGDYVFAMTDYIFDQIDVTGLYTRASQKYVPTLSKSQIYTTLSQQYGIRGTYDFESSEEQSFYAVTSYGDANYGYAILGKCTKIVMDLSIQETSSIVIENPLVYVYNRESIDTSKWELLKQNKLGALYRMKDTKIDVLKYNIE